MRRWAGGLAAATLVLSSAGGPGARAASQIRMGYLFTTYGFSSAQRFSRPSGVFHDRYRDEVYVADTGNRQIVILDKEGTPTARIPHTIPNRATGERRPGEPLSVVVLKNGDILVADNLCDYVDILDFRGRSVQKVRPADLVNRPSAPIKPRCLALDAAGNVYVGVSGHTNEILVLSPDLRLKAQFGVEASGDSRSITGIWADNEGRVYATYASGTGVRVFGPDGTQLAAFGAHDSGPQNFSLPSGLATDAMGRVWAVDALRHVVSVFDMTPSGAGLKSSFVSLVIGGMGRTTGDLTYPSAIASDGASRIFVLESTGARLQAFEILPSPGGGAPDGPAARARDGAAARAAHGA